MVILGAKVWARLPDVIPVGAIIYVAEGSDCGAVTGVMAAFIKVVDGFKTHFGQITRGVGRGESVRK